MSYEEVKKAMMVIREWCESRDALVECYKGCPMGDACCKLIYPCDWEEFCE